MKGSKAVSALVILLSTAACVSPMRLVGQQRLHAHDVTQLFNDTTVESVNINNGLTSFTYYHPDGRVMQERLWSRRAGTWRVTENGRICLTFSNTTCRTIERRGGVYYKVRDSKDGGQKTVVRYRGFAAGNRLLKPGQSWPAVAEFRP